MALATRIEPRFVRGENHPRARLTDALVREIRSQWRDGRSVNAIATCLGVNWKTVRRVLDGTTWGHVR